MSLDDILAAVGLGAEAGAVWRQNWQLSEASFAPDNPHFLTEEYVSKACQSLNMAPEIRGAFLEILPKCNNNRSLQRLAWHCHFLLFRSKEEQTAGIGSWPMLPGLDMFYALVFLSGLTHVRDIHGKLGISEAVTLDTLSDLQLWIYEYRKRYGVWGLKEKGWLVHHFRGKLFKLGRLQFLPGFFSYDFHVFRNNQDRKVIMLAGDNMCFRQDGQFDGTNKIFDAAGRWTAKFEVKDGHISGQPVSPYGKVSSCRIDLPTAGWREILKKNDPVLTVHIPATGPLVHAECGESFRQMAAFYPRCFPEYKFSALTCVSWLLDGQLEEQLPSASNIVRFLGEFYLHPVPNSDDQQTFERVFGRKFDDLNEAPQDTSLQRAIIKHVKNGGCWRSGGGILLPDDLKWGEQVYRN